MSETTGNRRRLWGDGWEDADGAGYAGTTESTVAVGIFGEILLMVGFGVVEGGSREDLGGDIAVTCEVESLLERCTAGFGHRELGGICGVDAGTILGADIVALAHPLGGIMIFPKDREQGLVGEFARIEDDEDSLAVSGLAGANFFVSRVGGEASGVSDGSRVYVG